MRKFNSKKLFSLLVAVVLSVTLVLSLTACDNNSQTTLKDNEVLVIGTTADFQSVNRLNAGGGGTKGYNYDVYSGMVSQLAPVYKTANGEFKPLLTNFTNNENSTEWNFTVVDGMKWHDGTLVGADDLVFTFNKQFKTNDGYKNNITSIDKVNDKQIKVTLSIPSPRFLNNLTPLRVMPKHLIDGKTIETLSDSDSVVGCGPFKFSRWDENAGVLEFVKFDDYPYADKVAIKKVIFKTYKKADLLDLAIQKGEIDMQYKYSGGLTATQEKALKNDTSLAFMPISDASNPCNLFFNNEKITNKNIRMAIKYSLDFDAIRGAFGSSVATPSTEGFVSPANLGSKTGYDVNTRKLTRAKELLQEEGYSAQNKLSYEILVRGDGIYPELAKIVKANIEETGLVNITIKNVEKSIYTDLINRRNFDITLGKLTAYGMGNQGGLGTMYFDPNNDLAYANVPTTKDGVKTAFGVILDNLKTAETLEQYLVYAEDFQNYCRDEVPAVSLYNDSFIQVYNKKLSGFSIDGTFGVLNIKTWESLKKA